MNFIGRWIRSFYFWVLLFILAGAALGAWWPSLGVSLKPLGDGFIALIKMLIGPVIFCTVVQGIAGAGDLKKAGRIGFKSLLYFEVVSTLALILGAVIGNLLRPGAGFNVPLNSLDPALVAEYSAKAAHYAGFAGFLLHIIPQTFVDAFTGNGDLIQILLIAVLFGGGLNSLGARAKPVNDLVEVTAEVFFVMVKRVMYLAPIGAGGAMAFTVGKYGIESLRSLLHLMFTFYLTCGLFVAVILGLIGWAVGLNIFKFVYVIRNELLTVLGTSSSESVLVPMMSQLEKLGVPRSIVGLVIPGGYSFNLDGTNIYLSLAILFIAQALNIDLTWSQQFALLAVATVTSKGAAGVTGSGFITLAATLAVVPDIPVSGLALILGVDRFMSEARAITNTIGNGFAALVIAKWEGELVPRDLS